LIPKFSNYDTLYPQHSIVISEEELIGITINIWFTALWTDLPTPGIQRSIKDIAKQACFDWHHFSLLYCSFQLF